MRIFIERRKSGRGFSYYRKDSKLTDASQLERINAFVIPPAWNEVKIAVNEKVKKVAAELGNTPAIARALYIDPYLFEQFEKSDTIARRFQHIKKLRKMPYLSKDEQCVVKLLSNK